MLGLGTSNWTRFKVASPQPLSGMYFLFERTYGNKNRGEFIDRSDRKRRRIVEKRKTSVDSCLRRRRSKPSVYTNGLVECVDRLQRRLVDRRGYIKKELRGIKSSFQAYVPFPVGGGGAELPIMAYREDSFRKRYLVQASSIRNGSVAGISLAVEAYETELRRIFMSVI